MRRETARRLFVATVALFACLAAGARAGEPSFHHGVVGVRLSTRFGASAAWSPDGKWIAVQAVGRLRLRNVETGELRELRAPVYRGFLAWSSRLDWSPDGRTIRYATSLLQPTNGVASWLTEVPLDGTEVRQQSLGLKAFDTDWAPGGWPFAFTTGTYAYDFDKGPIGPKPALLVVNRFGEAPRRIVQIKHDISEAEIQEVQFSPDGERILFCRYQRRHRYQYRHAAIWSVRPDGTDARRLWTALAGCGELHWSPQGHQVSLLAQKVGQLVQYPYVLSAASGKRRRIGNWDPVEGPIWSPDGRWLTFSTYEGEIRRVHPDGSGEQVIASFAEKEIQNLLWSPDGRHLAYTADEFASD
jgi:Tol biopolymer transport system component